MRERGWSTSPTKKGQVHEEKSSQFAHPPTHPLTQLTGRIHPKNKGRNQRSPKKLPYAPCAQTLPPRPSPRKIWVPQWPTPPYQRGAVSSQALDTRFLDKGLVLPPPPPPPKGGRGG